MKNLLPRWLKTNLRFLYNRYLSIFVSIKIQRIKPVIVYTMGKVGSSSVDASIKRHFLHYHVHTFRPERIERQRQKQDLLYLRQWEQIRRYIVEANHPALYITGVRNPIDRNISAFFERYEHYTGENFAQSKLSVDELIRIFHEQFEHERPLRWFDDELKTYLGVDVYEHPFPQEQGYHVIQANGKQILILKLESPDSTKEKALSEFLGMPLSLKRDNIGENKAYAEIYAEFKKRIVLSEAYINQMLDSRYTRHFYTAEEIARSREKWLSRLAAKNPAG